MTTFVTHRSGPAILSNLPDCSPADPLGKSSSRSVVWDDAVPGQFLLPEPGQRRKSWEFRPLPSAGLVLTQISAFFFNLPGLFWRKPIDRGFIFRSSSNVEMNHRTPIIWATPLRASTPVFPGWNASSWEFSSPWRLVSILYLWLERFFNIFHIFFIYIFYFFNFLRTLSSVSKREKPSWLCTTQTGSAKPSKAFFSF